MTKLENYAKLIATKGINVKPGQEVWIRANLDQPEFVAMVVEALYQAGAAYVKVEWNFQPVSKLTANYCTEEVLGSVPSYIETRYQYMAKELPAQLYLESSDPDGMKGVDQAKLSRASQKSYPIIKPYSDAMSNKYQWCIAAVPGVAWAKKIFPDLSDTEAVDALWKAILSTSRADGDDPCKAWDEHNADLAKRCKYLNEQHFAKLEYKSSNGTDFTVGLMEQSRFAGGGELSLLGNYFNPNIPSEEVFTSPKKGEAEGIVYSTKPLSYRGELIKNFSVRFENGRAVEVNAETGKELLEQMIGMDEGAAMLGECALIAEDSPINQTGLLFYNTLFDENASCHLALGRGFPDCMEGYENLSLEECHALGLNDSMIHVDFMIGAPDLCITGITKDGKRIPVFVNGAWAF